MQIQKVEISKIKTNPDNPRSIKKDQFQKLVKSIKEFPEMLEKRPIVVDENMIVLGGNMRLKACQDAGMKKVPIIIAKNWSEQKKKEFIIKDNSSFGEWDYDLLANEWDQEELTDWSTDINLPTEREFRDVYTKKINAPLYEPKEVKPEIDDMYDDTKYQKLIQEIDKSKIPKKEKEFLKLASTRHIVFNYSKIADYYAHSNQETQDLIEKNALVIIDFDKAIRGGYVQLQQSVYEQYSKEWE